MSGLHIGFISQWYDPEKGSAVTPGVQARALASLGHRVEVLTGWPHYPSGIVEPSFTKRPYVREQHGDIVVHRVAEYPNHHPNALGRFATYMSYASSAAAAAPQTLRNVDVVLVHSTPATAAIPAMALRALRGTPFVLHIQDLWPETVLASGFAGRVGAPLEGTLHRFCDTAYKQAYSIAVTSPGMADSIQRRGIPEDKLCFAPNWADESIFRPVTRNPALRAEFGLPSDAFVVMYAGNVGRIQGLEIVIEAAKLLSHRSDLHFAIVGNGVARKALQTRVETEKIERVHFIESQPFSRMGDVLAVADSQLISFVDEPLFRLTLPSKLQSLLAAGSPIIGAVAGDAARVIKSSGAGIVVPPGDGRLLAKAVAQMADNPELTAAWGRAGRDTYLTDFCEASSVRRLAELLTEAARVGKRT